MNARIILAAVAAICCVQGLAAASLARPLPWVETPAQASEMDFISELEGMNADEVFELVAMMVDQLEEETGIDLSPHVESLKASRAARNIFTCGTSIVNLVKTAKEVKNLIDEFSKNKADLKDARAACAAITPDPSIPGPVTNQCLKDAQEAFETASKATKGKVFPEVVKSGLALLSLKNCLSIF